MGLLIGYISPAKKMMYEDTISHKQLPIFLDRAELLMKYLKSLSYEELKKLLVCNNEIAALWINVNKVDRKK